MEPALWGLKGVFSTFGVDETGASAPVDIPEISTVDSEELTGWEAGSTSLLLLAMSSTVFTATSLTVA